MSVPNQPGINAVPGVEGVKSIASTADPVLRNLQITQCYCELSTAFAQRTGMVANWCTFATWASKQAGQTIRSNDLKQSLGAFLKIDDGVERSLGLIVSLAKQLGAGESLGQLRQSSIAIVLHHTATRAADAVSRGNKKVFEEIGFEFARFIASCSHDKMYTPANIDRFVRALKPGAPPGGQELLVKAFSNYYTAFFETDVKKKNETSLLANLQIGLHEQTRLQPEIAEALNAALSDKEKIKQQLLSLLFNNIGFLAKMRISFQRIFGQTSLLEKAVEELVVRTQKILRTVLTAHLMTLSIPPDKRLQLGRDLLTNYPDELKLLSHPALRQFLLQVDPTPDSMKDTGASDWGDLQERMHFISDLFRCYHLKKDMFNEAFTKEQVAAMRQGRLPSGKL